MKSITDLVPVEWQNRRVLTTAQLADAYKCSVDQIKVNFNANKRHYKEGLHYFKIAGKDLNDLRVRIPYLQISPKTRTLYLWTEQGAVRHCKSINTTEAWAMFDKLEENYFNPKPSPVIAAPAAESKRAAIRPELIYRVYVFQLEDNNSKLGRTTRLCIRIGEIERDTRLSVADIYFTPLMSFEDARLVERCCKEVFSSKRVTDEIFSVDFETACATVERFVKLVAVEPIAHKLNIATVNLKAAEKSE